MKKIVISILFVIAAVIAVALCTGCVRQAEKPTPPPAQAQALAPSPLPTAIPTAEPKPVEPAPVVKEARARKASVGQQFSQWVATNNPGDRKARVWAAKVAGMAKTWCARLGFPGREPEILATLWVESRLNHGAVGAGGELGMGQATPWSARHYGWKLRKAGFKGKLNEPVWQVGLCAAELQDKLATKGAMDHALRAYNGRGTPARKHLAKVKEVLKQAFNK